MKISKLHPCVNFGRAFTTKEKKEYEQIQKEARKELNLDKTTATIFDFSIPTAKNDTGMGSSFSKDAQQLSAFLKTMCGINSIQFQPQGQVSNMVRSPYSSTGFSIGYQLIDLTKLQDKSYGELLTANDLSKYTNRVKDHDRADYGNVFSADGHKALLEKAYTKFIKSDASSPLKKEFSTFKKENAYWLERDALFEAASVLHDSADMRTWPNRDKNIFSTPQGDKERIAQLKTVKNAKGLNVVDFEEFIQFIADKQQKEAKKEYNKQGIDIYGDCQIGFSQKDIWAHKSAFYENLEFGCDIGNGQYSCWSPAVNFDKLGSDAGELLYQKFNTLFKRYDGVRVDAAWQLMKPLICEPARNNDGTEIFDSNGNKIGYKAAHQPQIWDNGQYIIKNIILKAAADNGVSPDKVILELLGGNSYDSLDAVKGLGTTLIHISKYGHDKWGRVKFYESRGDNRYQNMKPGDYTIGPGTHDDETLIEQSYNRNYVNSRCGYLANDLRLNSHRLEHIPNEFADAAFAELFTTKNQFATLPDILGDTKRINHPNVNDGNWEYRAPQEYERHYFENLSEGKGLNMPDALSKALTAKYNGGKNLLVNKLEHFAQILRQKGPMTTKEADKIYA